MRLRHRLILFLALVLIGCATIPTPGERQQAADQLAAAQGWHSMLIPAGKFDLVAYVPEVFVKSEVLTVYIEGDGFAWLNGATPSADPTPRNPMVLRLALAQPEGNAAYLARPCQYVDAARTGCAQRYWTESRFSEETVAASDRAVDVLKQQAGAQRMVLIGYSGGGAIAALLAARRQDVERLVTVAGNLDHRAWTTYHRVKPLSDSLNPADMESSFADLPQTHFVGERDHVIPPELAYRWPKVFRGTHNANLRVIANRDHACCWNENWDSLYREAMSR